MAVFRSPARQAASVMKKLQGTVLRSVGTVRGYEQGLTRVAEWTQQQQIAGGLRAMTPELATRYLEERGQCVSQKTLDQERQALQAMMRYHTGKLASCERLTVVQSERQQALAGRAYSLEQAGLIAAAQAPHNKLATALAYTCGLRAHELLTLRPAGERTPDPRPASHEKFSGREGILYTVQGKGGLIREIHIPPYLAARLEERRLDAPHQVTDRGVNYLSQYDIGGGQRWSNSVSAASMRALGWSTGAHGLRHSYAQARMQDLQHGGLARDQALEVVSQEMGHFRPEITEVYLR